ncbi:hypothetical protein MBLNU457_1715t1 [Dothideomycetes sp. NU457]
MEPWVQVRWWLSQISPYDESHITNGKQRNKKAKEVYKLWAEEAGEQRTPPLDDAMDWIPSDDQPYEPREGNNEQETAQLLEDDEDVPWAEEMDEEEDVAVTAMTTGQLLAHDVFKLAITQFIALTMDDLSIFRSTDSILCGPSTTPIALRHLMDLTPRESLTAECMEAYLDVFRVSFPNVRILSIDEATRLFESKYYGHARPDSPQYQAFRSYLGLEHKRILIPLTPIKRDAKRKRKTHKNWGFLYVDGTQSPINIQSVVPLINQGLEATKNNAKCIRMLCKLGCQDASSPLFGKIVPDADNNVPARNHPSMLPREQHHESSEGSPNTVSHSRGSYDWSDAGHR